MKSKNYFNEQCDFILDHLKEVKALMGCFDRTKEELPNLIMKRLWELINRRRSALPGQQSEWYVRKYENGPGVQVEYEDICDKNSSIGLYFGVEGFEWDNLENTADLKNQPIVYLYRELGAKKKATLDQRKWDARFREFFEKEQAYIEKMGYYVQPPYAGEEQNRERYIAVTPVADHLNFERLAADPEMALTDVVEALVTFIKDLWPLCIKSKSI